MFTKMFKVSSKNQVTIPEKALKKIGISAGDKIVFVVQEDHLEIYPEKQTEISALELGSHFRNHTKKKASLGEIDAAIVKGYKKLAEKNK